MLAPAQSHSPQSLTRTAAKVCGIAVETLTAALLLFAPLAFGTTEPWSQEILLLAIALIAAFSVVGQILGGDQRPRVTLASIVMLAFIALVLVQLLPLSGETLARFSPQTVAVKTDLLQPLGQTLPPRATISFYSVATLASLRLLVGVSVLFWVISREYREPRKIIRLLASIVVAGMLVALLAVYQNLSRTKLVYGTVPMQHANAGPFMNYSHFSQFMNLSLAAALALLLIWSAQLKSRFALRGDVLMQLRQPANAPLWIAMALCTLGPIVIMLSMSRMGMLSMCAAGAVTLLMLSWRTRRSGRGSWAALIVLVVLAVVLGTCYDAIAARLLTLQNHELVAGGRIQILRDVATMARHFPLLGTGLGTHEYLFPAFSHLVIPQVVAHAENEFAEMLEECGGIGLALILAYIALIFRAYCSAVRQPNTPLRLGAFGLGFGWIAILIHSCSDFGQHTPAVAILTAIVGALLLNIAADNKSPRPAGRSLRGIVGGVALIVLIAIFVPLLRGADAARRAATLANAAQDRFDDLEQRHWQGNDETFRAMLRDAAAAAALQPGDVKLAYLLNAARWHTLARTYDVQTQTISLPPEAAAFIPQLKDAFVQTAALCPSYGPPLAMVGKLKLFYLNDLSGMDDIQTAYRLAPHDRGVCQLAAMLAAQQGRWAESLELFRKAIVLNASPRDAIDYYLSLAAPQMAFELAQGDRDRLLYVVERSKNDPALARLTDRCRRDAGTLLEQQAHAVDPPPAVIAEYARALQTAGQPEQASTWYRRALERDYGQVAWHVSLAQALADAGQPEAALKELRVCKNLGSDAAQLAAQVKLRGTAPLSHDDAAVETVSR